MPADGSGRLPEGAPTSDERAELKDLPNVHATGFGLRERGGELDHDEWVVRVYVHDKKPEDELADDEKVPATWMGWPTDVIEQDPPEPQFRGAREWSGWDIQYAAGSRVEIYDPQDGSNENGASCTPAFRDRNRDQMRVMLTNRHVVTTQGGESASYIEDNHEARFHNGGSESYKYIGKVRDAVDNGSADCAYFEVDGTQGVDGCNRPFAAPPMKKPKDGWPDPQLDERYINFGAKTGLTQGLVTDADYDDSNWSQNSIQFEDYSNGGDSGSLTATVDDSGYIVPVALHYAGGSGTSYAFGLNEIEAGMGWDLTTDDEAGPPDYAGSGQSGHIEQVVYNTFDTGSGTVKLRALIANTGGTAKSTTVGIRDDTDSEYLDETSVSLDPGEYVYHTYEINDSWLNSTVLNEDDYAEYDEWGDDGTGLESYHREISVVNETATKSPTEETAGAQVGGFALGETALGAAATTHNEIGVCEAYSSVQATATVDPPWYEDFDWASSDALTDHYSGDTAGFATSTSNAIHGSHTLVAGSTGSDTSHLIYDGSKAINDSQSYELEVIYDSTADTDVGFAAVDDSSTGWSDFSGYLFFLRQGNNEIRVDRWDSGSLGTNTSTSVSLPADERLRVQIDYRDSTSDTLTLTILDSSGAQLASASLTDTTYDITHPGFYRFDDAASATWHIDRGAEGDVSQTWSASDTLSATGSTTATVSTATIHSASDSLTATGTTTALVATTGTVPVSATLSASGTTAGTATVTTPTTTHTVSATLSVAGSVDATLVALAEFWQLDGKRIGVVTGETRDWEQITLTARADVSTVQNDIRPKMEHAGKYDVLSTSTGGFTAVDDANGQNEVTLSAPKARQDLRPMSYWHVDDYREEQIDQSGNEYEIEIAAVAAENKNTDGSYSYPAETRASDEWEFDFATGRFTTRRVRSDIGGQGRDGGRERSLTMLLDRAQTKTVEDNASRLHAVTRRAVPGGSNVAVDTSPDGRNTVTVTPPDGVTDAFDQGDYVVLGWETELLSDDAYQVTVDLLPVG